MKTLLFDLDDTLIDTNYRQFSVIRDIIIELGGYFNTSYNSYLDFRKDNNISNKKFVEYNYPIIPMQVFAKKFYNLIEEEKYLLLDNLLVNKEKLHSLSLKYKLILLSLRQHKSRGLNQLEKLGIDVFFEKIHFIPHEDQFVKAKFISSMGLKIEYFVGDSDIDRIAADHNSIPFLQIQYYCEENHIINNVNTIISSLI